MTPGLMFRRSMQPPASSGLPDGLQSDVVRKSAHGVLKGRSVGDLRLPHE